MEIRNFKDAIDFIFNCYMKYASLDDEYCIECLDNYAVEEVVEELSTLSNTDFESFSNVVSLLALDYYNVYYDDSENTIIEMMKISSSGDTFSADFVTNRWVLEDLVFNAIADYELRASYDYSDMYDVLQTEKGQEIYEAFHPDFESELCACMKYHREEQILRKIEQKSIFHPFEFFLLSLNLREVISDSNRIVEFLTTYLFDLEFYDIVLQRKVYSLLCQNFYAFMVTRGKESIPDYLTSKPTFDEMNQMSPSNFIQKAVSSPVKTKVLLHSFLIFNPVNYMEVLPEISCKDKRLLKRYEKITFQRAKK